ncbi:hypothetical protein F4802DRAFT_256193 [Xylaria palmicola]|nr:hypothetical protein F4802DRAFT_256193 [Xylaria palmicola]
MLCIMRLSLLVPISTALLRLRRMSQHGYAGSRRHPGARDSFDTSRTHGWYMGTRLLKTSWISCGRSTVPAVARLCFRLSSHLGGTPSLRTAVDKTGPIRGALYETECKEPKRDELDDACEGHS